MIVFDGSCKRANARPLVDVWVIALASSGAVPIVHVCAETLGILPYVSERFYVVVRANGCAFAWGACWRACHGIIL